MKNVTPQKVLFTIIIATAIGIVSLIVLTSVVTFSFPIVINLTNPRPLPPCPGPVPEGETYPPGICDENAGGGGMWPRGTLATNIPELIPWFIFLYFLSTCISSFISGFYLNRKQLHPKTHYWQSLISGLIIGAGGTVIFINSLVNELYTRMDVTNIAGVITRGLIFGLSSALVALIGYYVRGRGKESL